MALVAASALVFVPGQVNGLAYLSGAGSKSVFYPVDHSQSCAKGSCTTMTDGFLVSGSGGRTSVTWPDDVPLNQPFTVRAPVWAWGLGRQLFDGDSEAATALGTGLFVEVVSLIFAVMAARAIEDKALRGRRRAAALPERPGRPDVPPSPEQATPTGDQSWFPWDQ